MTVSGQFSCPPPGSFLAVSGQSPVAAVIGRERPREPLARAGRCMRERVELLAVGVDQVDVSLRVGGLVRTEPDPAGTASGGRRCCPRRASRARIGQASCLTPSRRPLRERQSASFLEPVDQDRGRRPGIGHIVRRATCRSVPPRAVRCRSVRRRGPDPLEVAAAALELLTHLAARRDTSSCGRRRLQGCDLRVYGGAGGARTHDRRIMSPVAAVALGAAWCRLVLVRAGAGGTEGRRVPRDEVMCQVVR